MEYLDRMQSTQYTALLIRRADVEHPPLWRIYAYLQVRRGKHVAGVTGHGITTELADKDARAHVAAFLGYR